MTQPAVDGSSDVNGIIRDPVDVWTINCVLCCYCSACSLWFFGDKNMGSDYVLTVELSWVLI